ncbi:MAG: ATP-binding protein [Oscillospiraceae bacterium]|nr:ATP-binding protein [Oscillospiraceae bacterium]
MDKKKLPIGIVDFAEMISEDFYYVDKTGMIKELLNNRGEVNYFTRPHGFGSTVNLSMLKYFFELDTDKSLFDGLAISKETDLCEKYMGQYPVVSVSFKGVEGKDYESALSQMRKVIGDEASRFSFLRDSDNLSEDDKNMYRQLTKAEPSGNSVYSISDNALISSLNTLTILLQKHYGKKVIVLIDEYDVPLAKANQFGYYDDMIMFIRGMFHQTLKTNPNLEFAVLTGCLRVSRESIFTGLNNTIVYSLLESRYDEQFGFTDEEVREMLDYYDLSEYYDLTKEWYDGYKIGRANVYNPWDVINWCYQLLGEMDHVPKCYWANSSSNEELKRFIERMGDGVTKTQIERLISGDTVQKKIEEQLTYDTMYDSIENMWSLLYATGYLTQSETPMGNVVRLAIPNTEVRTIFRDSVLNLFEKEVAQDGAMVTDFCNALKTGNAEEVERLFNDFMEKTISIRDTAVKKSFKESFYHGLLIGILSYKDGWSVDSNGESGNGYYDIAAEIEKEEIGIIIEVKYAENAQFESECQNAIKQINDNDYTAELKSDGMRTLWKYAIACYKKECKVVVEREDYEPK